MRKTVLVTGCSSGIGRATARRFLAGGWEVFATARDGADVRDLAAAGCRTAELDVTDPAAVDDAVRRVFDEFGRLDCLINNAGYGQFGPIEDVPGDAVRRQFEVNTFGPLQLIRAVLPAMRARGRGTVVNVTAGVGGLTPPGLGIYTASKFALESATDALRQEVSHLGVDVVTVEPGFVATDFYDRALAEIESTPHTDAYEDLYRVLESIDVVERGGPGINSPERVADVLFEAAEAPNPKPVYRVGPSAKLGTAAGALVRGRLRHSLSRLGVRALASGPAQRALDRRRPDRPRGVVRR
ncbi:SDR family oxidoreductase [Halosimplex aquaticum]|uniref:SDR family oxidoreductase n=1 Tax=Halosimplex aquaticum TaxID=3026162 RepID=A0ABD5Y544_9EURY|nr:SDR family oxidoreductase [Halosimplex aquaticum]